MTDEQRARKNARARERRARVKAERQLAATVNGGINPATKLPHTPAFTSSQSSSAS